MIKANPRLLVRTMFGTPAEVFDAASADDRAAVLDALMAVEPVSQRAAGLAIDAQVTSNLPRYELERVTAPTLLISLQDDLYGTWENARYTATQIPGSRFVSYAHGGHVWVGHDREVWGEVEGFIKTTPREIRDNAQHGMRVRTELRAAAAQALVRGVEPGQHLQPPADVGLAAHRELARDV